MNKYKLHLAFAIVSLLVISLFIFVLFRHIEIRKVELQNAKAVPDEMGVMPKRRKHTKKDDVLIFLRVVLVIVLLGVLIDESSRWMTILISYILVLILSLLFLAKGTEIPMSVRDRKWEYLALFSLLVFGAGACIAMIGLSALALATKYGTSYYGPARIVGYNQDDDDAVVRATGIASGLSDDMCLTINSRLMMLQMVGMMEAMRVTVEESLKRAKVRAKTTIKTTMTTKTTTKKKTRMKAKIMTKREKTIMKMKTMR